MKKTYINPTLEVVKIGTQQMLASSIKLIETEIGAGESLAPFREELNPAEILNLPGFVFE